ncbi:uncharacterized protein LOC123524853 [Mercenaria mercenaria]|uniref:uncharacterized protein LOC123524853 n=1 Tax=Mercenaria mercenaria TaxID=6596 RepID=UPI001E1DD13A|nr:uncharacterized protein LOC123524853 [Mercenaria mercenaria]
MYAILVSALIVCACAAPSVDFKAKGPCRFDGHTYVAGETILIAKCLATMECLGDNNYGNMTSLGGICQQKRETDGQKGCLFDGRVYGKGDKITIKPCLAQMTCDGFNIYKDMKSLGGVCPSKKRELNGQKDCLFDGRVYATGETIMIPSCLGEMTCLGRNKYSPITEFGGVCPEKQTREVDGQTGCLFDGHVYAAGQTITVQECLSKFTCLGYNKLSQITMLGDQC